MGEVAAAWGSVLDRVAVDSRVAWTAFHGARPLSLSDGVLAVAVAEPGYVRAIAQRGHDERLRQALIDVLGLDVTIDVVHDPAAASSSVQAGDAPAPAGVRRAQPQSSRPAATPAPARGAQLIQAAGTAEPDVADEPSEDDPDLTGADGLALVARELGARPIGEIDHT